MGSDHDMYLSPGELLEELPAAPAGYRPGQQRDPDRRVPGEVFPDRRIVLLSQHLGWRHDGPLASVADGDQQ